MSSHITIKPEHVKSWLAINAREGKPRKNGTEYKINNPFNADIGLHMNVNVATGKIHDWRSDSWAQGMPKHIITLIKLLRNCTVSQAYQELCGDDFSPDMLRHKMFFEKATEKLQEESKLIVPGSVISFSSNDYFEKLAIKYLNSRKISNEIIENNQIGYDG